ncbi:MAG: anthranilate synthase component I [Thermoflexales bacterium]|nr:anthranilate synthase component I [Thermoflexales bacterium]MDW8351590.1 anthranilate synthase component I [Anaerolineae bacterium]
MGRLTIKPSLEEVRALSAHGNLIPIYAELPSDLDTPVSLFLRLAGEDPAFLLESVSGGEQVARYSFIGVHVREAIVLRDGRLSRHTLTPDGLAVQPFPPGEGDLLDHVRREMAKYRFVPSSQLPRFCGGLVGYTGYDVVRQFERLPATATDVLRLPEAAYLLTDTLVAFDHAHQRLLIIANAYLDGAATLAEAYDDAVARIKTIHARLSAPIAMPKLNPVAVCTPPRANKSQAEFEYMVRTAKEYIRAGDIFQVVLSRRIERRTTAHPLAIYRALRMLNPSPWMFYFNFDGLLPENLKLIGASPEMHARFEGGIASVRPIAGTRRRGSNEHEDAALAKELLEDPKERAEHVMLVDLGRNDIGRVAEYGTVRVPELMVIERYSHVMHIVSLVEGRVRDGLDAFDVLRATFPAGTLTGAPKVRAMEIIEELEGERRGIYGGCVGYFSFNGQMDTCIAIRTIVMRDDTCYVQAGAGIVADSDPTAEFHETHNKARALMVAIDEAENS